MWEGSRLGWTEIGEVSTEGGAAPEKRQAPHSHLHFLVSRPAAPSSLANPPKTMQAAPPQSLPQGFPIHSQHSPSPTPSLPYSLPSFLPPKWCFLREPWISEVEASTGCSPPQSLTLSLVGKWEDASERTLIYSFNKHLSPPKLGAEDSELLKT